MAGDNYMGRTWINHRAIVRLEKLTKDVQLERENALWKRVFDSEMSSFSVKYEFWNRGNSHIDMLVNAFLIAIAGATRLRRFFNM